MDAEKIMTVEEIIVEKYGSINNFIDKKTVELRGELPMSRQHLYQLITHRVENPGIKTLNALADLVGVDKSLVYKEYSL